MSWTIGKKLISAFIGVALVTLAVGITGYQSLKKTEESIVEIADVRLPSVDSLLVIQREFTLGKSIARTLSIPGLDPKARMRQYDLLKELRVRYGKALEVYTPLPQTDKEAELWQKFQPAVQRWKELNNKLIDLNRQYDDIGVADPAQITSDIHKFSKDHYALVDNVLHLLYVDQKSFQGGDDHSVCAFGKWLEKFKTNNKQLQLQVDLLRQPHKQFHQAAGKIKQLCLQGECEKAKELYAKEMIPAMNLVFSSFKNVLASVDKSHELEHEIEELLLGKVRDAQHEAMGVLSEIVEINRDVAIQETIMAKEIAVSREIILIIASIIGLVLAIVIGIIVTRVITKPINRLAGVMERVEKTADFSQRVDITSEDEIGVVSRAFNSMIDAMQGAIAAANQSLSKVTEGDFTEKVTIDAVGDLDLLKSGINDTVDNIKETFGSLNNVMNALSEADFGRKIDVSDLDGEYKACVLSGTDAMQNSGKAINAINSVMGTVAGGEFDQRVEVALPGDLGTLKDNINQSMDVIEKGIEDTTRITVALSQGDLTQRVEVSHPGQFGILTKALNETMANITDVVGNIAEAAGVVSSASTEIADGNADMSKRTEQQASSLEETASSMEELTSTVKQNADNARQANQLAKGARDTATEGQEVVTNAVSAMEEINDSSNKIADIIGVIDEIAFQTNLLALNASVEAARAGEQGRGFAVVATEVRNLAQRSATAAKEIKELIQDSAGKVKTGSDLVAESGETLAEIVGGVKKVGDMIAEIAAASEEQTAGIGQVNQALASMDEITQQNAALAEEASANSENLNSQAITMNEQVQFFTLNNSQTARVKTTTVSPVAALSSPKAPKPKLSAAAKPTPADEWEEF